MSWWVYLEDDGETVSVARHAEGGTYAIGGIKRAELNVTYNYGQHFRDAWPEPVVGSGALEVRCSTASAPATRCRYWTQAVRRSARSG
jgi:hypothetical protein